MTKVILVDIAKCVHCQVCEVACKDEFQENDWSPYSKPQAPNQFWMKVAVLERGQPFKFKVDYVPTPCMHCQDAPCEKAATGGAVYRRPDGIVMIDPDKSVGQKQLVNSCPYGVIYWNQELNMPQKCTLCAHLLDRGWNEPRCVQACPTSAMAFGNYEDLKDTIDAKGAEVLRPELAAKPLVFYIGLPRTFITGALVDSTTGDCLKGAAVTLKGPAGTMQTKSDGFGDFWFDGLTAKKTYEITINAAGKTKTLSVPLDTDTNLGDITL